MSTHLPGIWQIFMLSLGDARRLAQTMWRALLLIVLATIVGSVASTVLSNLTPSLLGRATIEMLGGFAAVWLAAPYVMSLYRFLILGESVLRPETLRQQPSTQIFVAWGIFLNAIATVPVFLFSLATPTAEEAPRGPDPSSGWGALGFVLLLGLLVFTVRIVTLLPAAAIGRPVSVEHAFAESRGRFWYIIGAIYLPVLVIGAAGGLVFVVLTLLLGAFGLIVGGIILVAAILLLVLVTLCVNARLYLALTAGD